LQLELAALGKRCGYTPKREWEVPDRGDGRRGFIDLVWLLDDKILAAIELDRVYRRKPIFKLKQIQTEAKIWICWSGSSGYFHHLQIPPEIVCIFLERRYG